MRKSLDGAVGGRARIVVLFLLPWLVSLVVFWYGPILYTFTLSFSDYRLIGGGTFIGLENYLETFTDRFFWLGLQNTFVFTAMFIPANFVMGLLTAWLLASNVPGKAAFRAIVYLPSVLPVIAVLILGKFLFYPDGLVNSVIEVFGIPGPLWLANPMLIKPASVVVMVWQCGTAMVIYPGRVEGRAQTLLRVRAD